MMLDWLVYICLAAGAMLILYSLLFIRPDKKGGEDEININMERVERVLHVMDNADNTADEIYKLSQDVVSEIDDKYQQLLYLYNMIDEKAAKLDTAGVIDVRIGDGTLLTAQNESQKAKEAMKAIVGEKGINPGKMHEKYKDIFELHSKGSDIAEIARTLNIGQGEVKLVLELGKGR